jgi:hypothetical protein
MAWTILLPGALSATLNRLLKKRVGDGVVGSFEMAVEQDW